MPEGIRQAGRGFSAAETQEGAKTAQPDDLAPAFAAALSKNPEAARDVDLLAALSQRRGELTAAIAVLGKELTGGAVPERPQRRRLVELHQKLRAVERAMVAVAKGLPLSPTALHVDYRLAELLLQDTGQRMPPEQQVSLRVRHVQLDCGEDRLASATEAYAAALCALGEVRVDARGTLHELPDGGRSLTGRLHAAWARGVFGEAEAPADAASLRALARLREDRTLPAGVRALLEEATPEAVDEEARRLEALLASPTLAPLRGEVEAARRALAELRGRAPGGLVQALRGRVERLVELPERWAATLSNAAALWRDATVGGAMALRQAGAQEPPPSRMRVQARGRGERPGWTPADFARSVKLFRALGAVGARAALRPSASAASVEAARGALGLSERAAAVTGMALGEQLLRHGHVENGNDLFTQNLQHLLATRVLAMAQKPSAPSTPSAEKPTLPGEPPPETQPDTPGPSPTPEIHHVISGPPQSPRPGREVHHVISGPPQTRSSWLDRFSGIRAALAALRRKPPKDPDKR